METPVDSSGLAPVVPLIVRGDLAHYRFLARTANPSTLRAVILLMADDLEECLEVALAAEQRYSPLGLPGG
jgi:hypothetical protein